MSIYLIGGAVIFVLIIAIIIMGKILSGKNGQIKTANDKAKKATADKEKAIENINNVLDYEKQDDILIKQRETAVKNLVKTKSESKADEEIKTLMSNIRDAYNSL